MWGFCTRLSTIHVLQFKAEHIPIHHPTQERDLFRTAVRVTFRFSQCVCTQRCSPSSRLCFEPLLLDRGAPPHNRGVFVLHHIPHSLLGHSFIIRAFRIGVAPFHVYLSGTTQFLTISNLHSHISFCRCVVRQLHGDGSSDYAPLSFLVATHAGYAPRSTHATSTAACQRCTLRVCQVRAYLICTAPLPATTAGTGLRP